MATPVIQSSATASSNASDTLVITKPTGLASGDLMIAHIFQYDTSVSAINTPSGWTQATGGTNTNNGVFVVLRKIADSGDVSASDFTFTSTGGARDSMRGILFRITGHSATTPVAPSAYGDVLTSTTATPTSSPSFNPYSADPLLIMAYMSTNMSSSNSTISGYTISGTNPTWTEQYEDFESTDHTIGVATATGNSTSLITSISATLSSTGTRHIATLISIPSETAVVATPASVAIKTAQTAPTVKAAVTIVPASVPLTVETPTPVTKAGVNRWRNENKPSTSTWINPDKP